MFALRVELLLTSSRVSLWGGSIPPLRGSVFDMCSLPSARGSSSCRLSLSSTSVVSAVLLASLATN